MPPGHREGGQYVGVEQHAHGRQGCGELLDQAQRPGIDIRIILLVMARGVTQFQAGLGEQRGQRRVEGMADIEVFAFLAQIHRTQAHGKQRTTELFEDLPDRLARRQLASALLTAAAAIAGAPLIAGRTKLADDGIQLPIPGLRVVAHGCFSCSAAWDW